MSRVSLQTCTISWKPSTLTCVQLLSPPSSITCLLMRRVSGLSGKAGQFNLELSHSNLWFLANGWQDVTVVGSSLGGAVIWSYIELYGHQHLGKAVFVDQVLPLMCEGFHKVCNTCSAQSSVLLPGLSITFL